MDRSVYAVLALTTISFATMTGCAASTEPGEELGESEDRLLAGRRLSEREIASVLREAGWPENQVPRMVCTAKYESSFYERASNRNRNGSMDRGLFQINSIHVGGTRGCPSSSDALWNATTNAKCALAIFRTQGNNAWYGYRKHRTECDNYTIRGGAAPSGGTNSADTNDDDEPGGCWSGTLQDIVAPRTCVQSRFDNLFYQCMEGTWYRGGESGAGRFGACSSTHQL